MGDTVIRPEGAGLWVRIGRGLPRPHLRPRGAALALLLLALLWPGHAPTSSAAPPPGYGRAPLAGVVEVGKLLPAPAREAPGQPRLTIPLRRVPGGPGPTAPAAGPTAQAPATLAPIATGLQAGASFAGIPDNAVTEPPDPIMAIGPGRLIELTNVGGRVFERNGTAVGSAFSLAAFFVPSNSPFTAKSLFDPTVVYDSLSGRFFAAAAAADTTNPASATATRFFVAVSQTSDPSGAWYQYGPIDPGTNVFADFPHIGFSDDKFVVTYNAFAIDNSNFLGNAVWVFDKADMTAGGAVDTFTANVGCGALCYGAVRPAYALSVGATLYMAGFGSSSTLTVFSVTGTAGAANVSIAATNLTVASVTAPPAAPQKNSSQTIDTGDGRILDAVWRQGHLWVSAGAACGSSPVLACAYYADVLTGPPMSVNANFTYGATQDGASGAYYYYPAITVGGDGTLYSVLSRSSSAEFVSVRAFRVLPGQTPEATLLLKAGESAYVSGATPGRWGDYYAAALDPTAPNVAWVVGQYAAASGLWGTWLAQVFPADSIPPPAAPTWAGATPLSASQIRLKWNDNATNETGYRIRRFDGSGWPLVGQVGANVTTFTDTGLAGGTAYAYWVTAFNSAGEVWAPAPLLALTQGDFVQAPEIQSAVGVSPTQIRITWQDHSSNETGFKILRFDGSSWVEVGDVPAGSTAFVDSGLTPGTSYYYWMDSYNGLGPAYAPAILFASTWPSPVDPQAPTLTGATVGSSSATIMWNDNTTDENAFSVRRFDGSSWPEIAQTSANQASYTDSGLSPGGLYFYWLAAIGNGYSKFAPVPLTLRTSGAWLAAPTLQWAAGISSTQVQIQWADNSTNETGFKIFRSTGGGWTQVATVGTNVTTFTDSGLSPGTSYYYWVWAYNSQGNAWAPRVLFGTTYP